MELSAGTLGDELFARGVVDVVEDLVGLLAPLGRAVVEGFVDVTQDVAAVVGEIGVFAGGIVPGEAGIGIGIVEQCGEAEKSDEKREAGSHARNDSGKKGNWEREID